MSQESLRDLEILRNERVVASASSAVYALLRQSLYCCTSKASKAKSSSRVVASLSLRKIARSRIFAARALS